MRSAKTRRVDDPDSAPPLPRLLRDLAVVRAPLFELLATCDVVSLLATCHALRDDDETTQYALEANETTRCFFHGCLLDWCAPTPMFTWLDSFWCDGDHEESSESGAESESESDSKSGDSDDASEGDDASDQASECETGEEQDGDDDTDCSDDEEDMDAVMASPARRASLLSLAALIQTELASVLYCDDAACVTRYYAVPFILPLSRMQKVDQPPGFPTPLGLHIQNCALDDEQSDIVCKLCAAIVTAPDVASEYQAEREEEAAQLTQKIHDKGFDDQSDEFKDAMDAFDESKRETDELYNEDRYDQDSIDHTIAELMERSKLADVELCGGVDYDTALEACHIDYYYMQDGYCARKLCPLAAFFLHNGFGPVHRVMIEDFSMVDGEAAKGEVRSVEMVGAAAPHGFFAGVYFIAMYT